tara:strand:- start:2213 stop:3142 length:930 start_codon:yes stop_codon:yes gene_type:complete
MSIKILQSTLNDIFDILNRFDKNTDRKLHNEKEMTKLNIKLKGRLGNQIYQIMTGLSYAINNNISFDNIYITNYKNINDSNIFQSISFLFKQPTNTKSFTIKDCNDLGYYNLPFQKCDQIIMDGYFQSYLFFEKNFEKLKSILNIKLLQNKVKDEFLHLINEADATIHFRIGDYVKFKDSHPVLSINYYVNAINKLNTINPECKKIKIFYQPNDHEIIKQKLNILMNKFKNHEFTMIDNQIEDWKQMLIMSLIKNNIIANSTFSWWSAYLNINNNNTVIYPSIWFGPKIFKNMTTKQKKDRFPEKWICV